ncbi:microfibril-associated glycoprotein 4-like [Diadema setosum]|uniref:microfibril-associated glycoprotein 4-like n=1 Tax=Diadema setosum TaxID=31175 RepID=UPI003B3AF4E3
MAVIWEIRKVSLFAVVVIVLSLQFVDGSECESSYAYMESSTSSDRGKMLSGHLVRNVTGVRSVGECLAICLRQGANCQSFNFASSLRVCHVNDGTKSDHPNDFVSDSDFNYYGPSSSAHWLDTEVTCSDDSSCYNSASCTEYCHPPWFRCDCPSDFTGQQCTLSVHYDGIASNCKDYYNAGHTTSGVLQINPGGSGAFDVYCDMDTDGGGWTIFQKRQDGSQDFYLGWSDYVNGFGTVSGEYWLGLERLYRLASSTVVLRVDLQDWNYNWYYAQYYFYIHASNDHYRGYFWSYSGTAGDSLSYHNGYQFSTYDADHDGWGGNCAYTYRGAWWHNSCHHSNLNADYVNGGYTSGSANSAVWYHLHGHNYALMRTEMKIRG